MTPGEISPGAQKSSQIFDSCPGSGRKMAFLEFSGGTSDGKTMQCVLDWIRAGLPEDIGHKEDGYGWRGGIAWKGLEEAVVEDLDFEEEGVAVEENGWRHWKEGQKLGGGAHQGQSGWSKTTGATDL
ncbi:hypothetical protein BY996DRAFT_8689591 [Phakopsora pachyrhizi]|nr:hypothetical protein BY996DRAFT_8689591 [Phakopsora pachyrhizi]